MLYSPHCPLAAAGKLKVEARVVNLFIKPSHGTPMEAQTALTAVAGKGLTGDAAFGTSRRQVLVIDVETLNRFGLVPGAVRENITIEGIILKGVRRGARLRIGDVVLHVSGDCTPCAYIDGLRPGLREAMVGQRGVLAQVEHGGTLAVGDPIRLEAPAPHEGPAP